uniref:Uncharacterized protein n=1 Tax=Magallana gigas TaxID=29159 RepID=A0A8W8IFJ4_MAGGI
MVWGDRCLTNGRRAEKPWHHRGPVRPVLCLADRENGRIQCFDLDGNFQLLMPLHPMSPEFGDRILQCPLPAAWRSFIRRQWTVVIRNAPMQGFIIDINDGQLIETWNAKPVWRFDMKADDGTGGRGNIIHSGTTPSSSGTTIKPHLWTPKKRTRSR